MHTYIITTVVHGSKTYSVVAESQGQAESAFLDALDSGNPWTPIRERFNTEYINQIVRVRNDNEAAL